MPEKKSLLQRVLLLALLIFLAAMVLFHRMAPAVESVRNILLNGDLAYIAMAEQGIRILDTSDPNQPQEVGKFDTYGQANRLALIIDDPQDGLGKRYYLFVADGSNGLVMLNVTTPGEITQVWRFSDIDKAQDVIIKGNNIFVVDSGKGIFRLPFDELPPTPEQLVAFKNPVIAKDGYRRLVYYGGKAVGVRGENSIDIIDISDLNNIRPVSTFDAPSRVNDIAVLDGKVFVATANHGVGWILRPSAETSALDGQTTNDETTLIPGQIQTLDAYGNHLYVGVAGQGLAMYDVSNVPNVELVAKENVPRNPTALVHHQQYLYVGDGRKGINAVRIGEDWKVSAVPQSDSAQMGLMGSVEDVAVHPDGYIYLASCQQGVQILRLDDNQLKEQYIAKEAHGCAASVAVSDDFLATAYLERGIHIYSITNSFVSPRWIAQADTEGTSRDVAIKGHYAYIADGDAGLQVIDMAAVINPIAAQVKFDAGADAQGVHIYGDYAYVAAGLRGLQIVNIADPLNPILEKTVNLDTYARAVFVYPIPYGEGGEKGSVHAYVTGGGENRASGVWIVDVSNPKEPKKLGSHSTTNPALDVAADGRLVYVLEEGRGLRVFNVTDPNAIQDTSPEPVEGNYSGLAVAAHQVVVGKKMQGVEVFKIDDPAHPVSVASIGGVGVVRDALMVGHYLYTVDGDKGVWVVDLKDPKNLSMLHYPTPGTAQAISAAGNKLYVADGNKGLLVLTIGENGSLARAGAFDALQDVSEVAVRGNYTYVVNVSRFIDIFNTANPAAITHAGVFPSQAPVVDMSVAGRYLYLAEGEAGIEVVDIADPTKPTKVPFSADVELTNVQAIRVAEAANYLYVAQGEKGLKVLNVANPTQARLVAEFASQGAFVDIDLMNQYIIAADSAGGARLFSFLTEDDVYEVPNGAVGGMVQHAYGVDLTPLKTLDFHVLVTNDQDGISIHEETKTVGLAALGWYETPGRATFGELLTRRDNPTRIQQAASRLLAAVFGYVLATYVVLAVFSGVILPIEGESIFQREVIRRLIYYMFDLHGPVSFIQEGKVETRSGKFRKIGLGVVNIDASSGAVFERQAYLPGGVRRLLRFIGSHHPRENLTMRAAGPGVVFTRMGERIRDNAVDLRRQIRLRPGVRAHTRDGIEVQCVVLALFTIGEDPDVLRVTYEIGEDGLEKAKNLRVIQLGLRDPNEDDGEIYKVQNVRNLADDLDAEDKEEIHRFVQAYRRRGAITPNRDTEENNGWRPLKYDPERVLAAVAAQPYDVFYGKDGDWGEIPVHLAVNVFREMLSKKMYDQLYMPTESGKKPPFRDIANRMRTRMIQQGTLAFQFVERKDGAPIAIKQDWLESQVVYYPERDLQSYKVLRARGIKLIHAGFTEMTPTRDDVRGQYLYDFWSAPWQQRATIVQADHELQAFRLKNKARTDAERDMADLLRRILRTETLSREALAVRVFQALEGVASDPLTQKLLPKDTIYLMRNLRRLLLPGDDDTPAATIPPD